LNVAPLGLADNSFIQKSNFKNLAGHPLWRGWATAHKLRTFAVECHRNLDGPVFLVGKVMPVSIRSVVHSLTRTDSEDESRKHANQQERPEPMISVPAMLLLLPIVRRRLCCPLRNAVVYWNGSNKRKLDTKDRFVEGNLLA
jgi:hypothetical protein